jgi:hypothetical protein
LRCAYTRHLLFGGGERRSRRMITIRKMIKSRGTSKSRTLTSCSSSGKAAAQVKAIEQEVTEETERNENPVPGWAGLRRTQ